MKPPTIAPAYACLYPGLAEKARSKGYALGIHGTVLTDLDLIACPWTDEAVSADELAACLMDYIGACYYPELLMRQGLTKEQADDIAKKVRERNPQPKPHGRRAWNLYLDMGCRVDLSVMPRDTGSEYTHNQALSDLLGQIAAMKERSEKYEAEEKAEGRIDDAEKHMRVFCVLKELERLGHAFEARADA